MRSVETIRQAADRAKEFAAPFAASLMLATGIGNMMIEPTSAELNQSGGTMAPGLPIAPGSSPEGGTVAPGTTDKSGGTKGPEDSTPIPVQEVSQLAGYNLRISRHQINTQKDSTVEIMYRTNIDGQSTPWLEACSGVKLSIPSSNETDVLSAGHCFWPATGSATGVFTKLGQAGIGAENYFGVGVIQYAITDPEAPALYRDQNPIAMVDGISVDTAGVDLALLRVQAIDPNTPTAKKPRERTFDSIPSIPASNFKHHAPTPGEQVELTGVPVSSAKLVSTTGRYIGTYIWSVPQSDGTVVDRPLEMVAINPPSAAKDADNYGDSGGPAGEPDNQLLGEISTRINVGYGKNHIFQPQDRPADNRILMKIVQEGLHVKLLGRYVGLAGITPPPTPDIIQTLVNGFDIPASSFK